MVCCRNECTYLSIIIGILAGVALGALYAFGFIATGVVFLVYLVVGILGILLMPIYAMDDAEKERESCPCRYMNLLTIGTAGTIITAAVGLITAPVASTTVVAIVTGLATFFLVFLLVTIICLARCICRKNSCYLR